MNTFDAIVVGVGGIGSASVYHLAKQGCKVLGLERHTIANDLGSSHGQTRIIRKAYFEHPDYVPILHKTYDLWNDLESTSGRQLIHKTGLLMVGKELDRVISGVQESIDQYNLRIESITIDELHHRFPGFSVSENMSALYEADAGYLLPELAIRTHVDLAIALGATILTHQEVIEWSASNTSIEVITRDDRYLADHLIICGGAWSHRLLVDLNLPFEIRRKPVFWYDVGTSVYHADSGCPVFGFDTDDGFYYGFPVIDESGLKVANHSGGQSVSNPDGIDRSLHPQDETGVIHFLNTYLPQAKPIRKTYSICMYTMTPDEHFIIDHHRDYPNVHYAAGFSGHGFKFAPIIGSILTDFVVHGSTTEPVGFLSASRSSLLNG